MRKKIIITLTICLFAAGSIINVHMAQNDHNMNFSLSDISVMAQADGETGEPIYWVFTTLDSYVVDIWYEECVGVSQYIVLVECRRVETTTTTTCMLGGHYICESGKKTSVGQSCDECPS